MKKRLLITSIVMMLVVAVALSTATYAWFTSNDAVTATTVTLTAESSSGAALGIAWNGGTTGTLITANDPATTQPVTKYKPMIPSALTVATDNTATNLANVTWSGATKRMDGSVEKFNAPYTSLAPYQYNGTVSSEAVDIFYIENLSDTNNIASITMSLNSVSDTNAFLRVAVFTSASASGDYLLRAVLAANNGAATTYGTVTENANVSSITGSTSATSSYTISNLAAQQKIYFKVVAWLDGVVLNDSNAGQTATVGLKFQA